MSRRPAAIVRALLKGAVLAVIVVFWAVLVQRNWMELGRLELRLDPAWVLASLATFCLYFLGLGLGWGFVVRSLGYSCPLAAATRIWVVSMPARYVPGNVWHIVSRVRLAGGWGIPSEGVLVSSSIEQLLTVLTAAFLGIGWLTSFSGASWYQWVLPMSVVGLLAMQPPVIRFFLRLACRMLHRAEPTFQLGYRRMVLLFLWYAAVNLVNGVGLACLAVALGLAPAGGWGPAISAYCLAYVIGYLSFVTPSGLGVREAALTSMLSLSSPMAGAIALGLLARLLSMAGEAVAVLLATIVLPVTLARSRSGTMEA